MVVEDEALFRDMLQECLAAQPAFEVVGGVSDGAAAVRLAEECDPDVVLLDIELGGEPNGIAAGHLIRHAHPQVGIIILSAHEDRGYLQAIPTDQPNGWSYLTKRSVLNLATLTQAITAVAAGLMVVDPVLLKSLDWASSGPLADLSHRQLQVLELMAQGYNNGAIAQQLFLSDKSVENTVNSIYRHLLISRDRSVQPRVAAVLTYLENSRHV